MKKLIILFIIAAARLVEADVSTRVKFITNTTGPLKVEILRDGANATDVTTTLFACGTPPEQCAIVPQPVAPATYLFSVRVTDSIGVVRTSNTVAVVIPNSGTPACQGAQVIVTTGTPTPVPTPTP